MGQCRASVHLHADLLLNVLKSPGQFFDTTPLGRILNRFSKDIDTVDTMIPSNIRIFLITCFHVLLTVMVIAISTPLVVVTFVPLSVLYYFIQVPVATNKSTESLFHSLFDQVEFFCSNVLCALVTVFAVVFLFFCFFFGKNDLV